jgi:hypothetical protein
MIMNSKIVSVAGVLAFATFGVLAAGCGGAHLSQLKEAAEADLNCPKSRVHILNAGKTRDIEACGQRATYHYEDGDWRMIARSGPAGAPGQAGAPVMKSAPGVAPAQPAPVMTPTSTPSQPPGTPSQPPPSSAAPGKQI